ncbi:MAG TPA: MerR family transcriptional regulator [Thermomicrobiales bacterium]|jgi:DNA-binding transcriptional MerR regulator|nr:MerR family transcriptional regulator [Thermomicrobiales bacterium]
MTNAQHRFSLAELTEAAGVSVRTVRYYISEGLLPPPVGSGPKSYYTRSHLDRLRAIGRMRANYLPLREIRRRLGGMSEQQIRALARDEPAAAEEAAEPADVAARRPVPALRTEASASLDDAPMMYQPREPFGDADLDAFDWESAASAAEPAWAPAPPVEPTASVEAETWHRFKLGDEAELLIRSSLLRRRRDRVEWLVDWARKVFR